MSGGHRPPAIASSNWQAIWNRKTTLMTGLAMGARSGSMSILPPRKANGPPTTSTATRMIRSRFASRGHRMHWPFSS